MQPGEVIAGRFAVDRLAARGGMGEVYRARDLHTDELVALKVIRAGDARALERFLREARLLAELRHPAIVSYVSHGRTDFGELYLAMEWLEGEDLDHRLAVAELTLGDSVRVALQAAAALAVAHARQIVHRDVKPSNLFLLDWQVDRVKLLDFGIARLARAEGVTRTGMMIGTPGFMAPEQARGEKDLDARADVYGLGNVLFRCLAGRLPFAGAAPAELLARVVAEDPPRLRDFTPVPAALDELVDRMLARDPARRPADAGKVLAQLAAFADGMSAPTFPSGGGELGGREQRLHSVVAASGPGREALSRLAPGFGAECSAERDAFTAILAATGAATDEAAQAARLALETRLRAPEARLALVTGRLDPHHPGRLLARAVAQVGDDPGVRIDAVTAGLLDGRFEVVGEGNALALVAEREADDAARTVLGRPTPFVGRDRELARIQGVFAEVEAESVARAVLVTAPAGTGKSRLRQELCRWLRGRGEPVEIWIGRGEPMRAGAPFHLLGDAIRRAAGVTGSEPAPIRQGLLRDHAERLGPDLTAYLGELAGIPFDDHPGARASRRDPVAMLDRVRAAWIELVRAESADRPLLLILEDLHWGDLPSVKLVDAALRDLAERPFLVVAAARPEVHEVFPRLWAERGLEELHLGPLSRRASERLVRDMLADAPADKIALAVEHARGSPLHLEEMIRHLAGGGGSALPEALLAMVSARLEAMEPEARRVLRAASVFGEVFWTGGLRALVGAPPAELDHWLGHLIDREVIARRDRARFPGDEEHAFTHSLLREAAYALLTETDLALGHKLAGAWLETAGETEAVVVAEHFERGGETARAADWFRRAAEQALLANDWHAVLSRAGRGLALGAAGDPRGALLLSQAIAHSWIGDNESAERTAREAMALLPVGSTAWSLATGEAAAAAGKRFEKASLRELAAELARGEATGAAQEVAFYRTAAQCFLCGEPESGRALIDRVPASDDPVVQGWRETALCYGAVTRGDYHAGQRHAEAAAQGYERGGDARHACVARVDASWPLIELGAFEEGLAGCERAAAEARRLGLVAAEQFGRVYATWAHVHLGNLDEAFARARRHSEDAASLTRSPRIYALSHAMLAMVLFARGDLEGAERSLRVAIAPGAAAYPPALWIQGMLALVRVQRGDPDEGLQLANRSLAYMDPARGLAIHEAVPRLARAEALHALGRADEGRAEIALARRRLVGRAELIADPERRRAFLERVWYHAETLARAREWGAED